MLKVVGELEVLGLDPQDVVVQTVAEVTDVGIQSGLVEQDVGVQAAVDVREALDVMEVEQELDREDGTELNDEEKRETVGTNESFLAKPET